MSVISNTFLLLLQCSCFTITLTLAIVLLFARLHLHTESRAYEISRWMLFASLVLFAVHFLLQMLYGFRARGEDVGALVNILFYTPIAMFLVCSLLRVSTGVRYLRRFVAVGVVCTVLNLVIFLIGLYHYRSLHMPWALNIMEVVFVAMVAFFDIYPCKELRRMSRKIEDETADDNSKFSTHMRTGTVMLYAMGAIGALSIFRTTSTAIVAVFFFVTFAFYVVSFVMLGFNIHTLTSIVDEEYPLQITPPKAEAVSPEAPASPMPTPASPEAEQAEADAALSAEQAERISRAIAQWRAEHGYSTSNLTSITMARRLGIPKRLLTQYLAKREGCTFRVWLSAIRIEESKRMLLTQPDYSIEAIAEACGFSSRSWMQEKFKASTGMTPAEWRETQSSLLR